MTDDTPRPDLDEATECIGFIVTPDDGDPASASYAARSEAFRRLGAAMTTAGADSVSDYVDQLRQRYGAAAVAELQALMGVRVTGTGELRRSRTHCPAGRSS